MKLATLSALTAIGVLLSGCATGAPGSARRICYNSGLQPGTSEFSNCWKGVRDQQFANDWQMIKEPLAASALVAITVANAKRAGEARAAARIVSEQESASKPTIVRPVPPPQQFGTPMTVQQSRTTITGVQPSANSYSAASRSGSSPALPTSGSQRTPQLCPNGRYVVGTCTIAPDGSYVGGPPQIAPNGTYVTGTPRITPNGSYVGGEGPMLMCPNGSYIVGNSCQLMPNGQYVGQ